MAARQPTTFSHGHRRFEAGLALVALLCALAWASPGQAVMITQSSTGSSFTVDWLLASGASDANGNVNEYDVDITAEAIFAVDSFDDVNDFIDFTIQVTNTTPPNDDEIGLWKIGFGTDPDATGVAFSDDADGVFNDAELGSPSAFPDSTVIDITATTDAGTPRTLQAGEMDLFGLRVFFDSLSSTSAVDVTPFNAFFQANPDSFQVRSVPAPGVLGLLGAGLVALGVSSRRGRRSPRLG